ncbi:MAG TPA: hypothetical protein VK922_15545 [Gemmatimonadaceae bacterium]|nr:hypothetical protein [Gemmatimonadaceae bacterium]
MPLALGDGIPRPGDAAHPALAYLDAQQGRPVVLFLLRAFT